MKTKLERVVESPLGRKQLDSTGAAIGASRVNPDNVYGPIPMLLKEYINEGSEKAWDEIGQRIDNVYFAVSTAMEALDSEEPFSAEVSELVAAGKLLLFKPNLVTLPTLDPETHDPALVGTCTPWSFLAAVMRWFHDKCAITYYRMAVGEAGTATSKAAIMASKVFGMNVTTQALMEGKCGNYFGGWGFYFARKYLAERLTSNQTDNPLNGYEESLEGTCLPPGDAKDRLMLYDLNKTGDNLSFGREVPVVGGLNFKSIIIHKAVIGGDPNDTEECRKWPGCVLVNVCKLKIHLHDLFTCAIKNLGIGLYPMEVKELDSNGKFHWKYAIPNLQTPCLKLRLPHTRWVPECDSDTLAPLRDKNGNYIAAETGGLQATMADCLQAIKAQGITIIHVADALEAVNINHCGPGCTSVPEGFVFA
ncbi:DUF362 domain-containing protein, partial [Chloroflexota bacterium]